MVKGRAMPIDDGRCVGNMEALLWTILFIGVFGGYLLHKLFRFYFSDGDFVTLSKSMRPEYFRDKVVWVTGASSGSE